ncbi:cytochrome b/b6 domain-containing protein [Vibrio sp. 2-Bac 85]
MNLNNKKIKVWDFSTRFFHWAMVLLLVGLWWTAENGEMQWHQICAYLLMTLILFRLIWGFWGSETALFKQFIVSPKQVISYTLKEPKPKTLGHNPLGGYMVVVLLSLIALQLGTGLFATDEIFTEGPLVSLVSSDTANWLTWVHKNNFNIIIAMAAVHILAVVVHLLKGENLINAMFTGYKELSGHKKNASDKDLTDSTDAPKLRSQLVALVIVAIIFALVWFYLLAPVVSFL